MFMHHRIYTRVKSTMVLLGYIFFVGGGVFFLDMHIDSRLLYYYWNKGSK